MDSRLMMRCVSEVMGSFIAAGAGFIAEGLMAGDFASKEMPSPKTMFTTILAFQLADRILNALSESSDPSKAIDKALAITGKAAIVAVPATLALLGTSDGLNIPNFNANHFPFFIAVTLIHGISTLSAAGLDRVGCKNTAARAALDIMVTVGAVFAAVAAGPGWLGGIPPVDAQRTLGVPFAAATFSAMVFGLGAGLLTERCSRSVQSEAEKPLLSPSDAQVQASEVSLELGVG